MKTVWNISVYVYNFITFTTLKNKTQKTTKT